MVLAPKDTLKCMNEKHMEDAATSTNIHPAEDVPTFEQIAADVIQHHADSVCFGCAMLNASRTDEEVDMYSEPAYHELGCSARHNPDVLVKMHLPPVLDRLGFISAYALVEITVNVLSLLRHDPRFK